MSFTIKRKGGSAFFVAENESSVCLDEVFRLQNIQNSVVSLQHLRKNNLSCEYMDTPKTIQIMNYVIST